MSVLRNLFRTALPKLPVPPVIRRTLSLNTDILFLSKLLISNFKLANFDLSGGGPKLIFA
jgi:hypothetical protein